MVKSKNSRKHVNILEINVNSTSKKRVLREIQSKLNKGNKFYIVTPNPEQVLIARNDPQYKDILNYADISIPDGIGLVAASRFNSLPRPKNFFKRALVLFAQGMGVGFSVIFDKGWLTEDIELIKGRELFIDLIKLANKKDWKVVLVGNSSKSAQKAAKKLRENFIKLNIVGFSGPYLKDSGMLKSTKDVAIEKKVIKKINDEKPELLFIGFRSPVQEKWLYRQYDNLDFICAMIVGGTFDYVSGKKLLPPKWVEDLNLEWFWRLIRGDQKIKRVFRAFPKFAWRVYWDKLVKLQ